MPVCRWRCGRRSGRSARQVFTALTGPDGIFIVERVRLKGHRHGEKLWVSRKVVDEQLVQALAIGYASLAQRQGAVAHVPGGSQGRIQLFADLQRLHLGNLADMFFWPEPPAVPSTATS